MFTSTFSDFMCKRAYWNELVPFIDGIYDDLQNIGATIAKLDLFYIEWGRNRFDANRFIITELEYLFAVCRSLYDLLQECISRMWLKFKFYDPMLGKVELPSSFRQMLMESNNVMSSERIAAKYRLPTELADYYFRQSDFFKWLREY